MMRKIQAISVGVAMAIGMTAYDAAAWGPKAQRAIAGTATQVIRRSFPSAFKTYENSYESDVLRGCISEREGASQTKTVLNETDAFSAIDKEIQLLREARKYGFGSYFSYRMGALAALIADLFLPHAMDLSPGGTRMHEQIEADIDLHLDGYRFVPHAIAPRVIRSSAEYFKASCPFAVETKRIVADDYVRGNGYRGYLNQGGQAMFGRAIEAVADAWFTVLRVQSDPSDLPPSRAIAAWYLADEIEYLLLHKRNFHEAVKAHKRFTQVNPAIAEAYDKVGDVFYAFGTEESQDHAIAEWQVAYNTTGADRRRIAKKLAGHHIKVGQAALARADLPGASEEELPMALNAFTMALEFDQTSEAAASLIGETNVMISERRDRRELNVSIIATAEKVIVEAERSQMGGDFGNAIATYNKASSLFDLINDEFKDQAEAAEQRTKLIKKKVNDVITDVLDAGTETIEQGDRAVDEHRFDDALAAYQRVPGIVSVIPGDETTRYGREKLELIDNANNQVEEAERARNRWAELQLKKEETAKKAAGS